MHAALERFQRPTFQLRHSNYFPAEMDDWTWETKEQAEERIRQLGDDMWEVV